MQRLKIEVVTDDGREMVLFESGISEFSYLDAAGGIRVEAKVKSAAAATTSSTTGANTGLVDFLNRLTGPKVRTEEDERRAEIAGARRARAKLAQIEAEQRADQEPSLSDGETDFDVVGETDADVIGDTDAGDLEAV